MIKAVLLDRDGTVIAEPADEIVDRLDKVRILANTIPGLKLLMKAPYKIFFITNQNGVNLGRLDVETFHQINDFILKQLKKEKIRIEKTYFCPHVAVDNCNCRKPKTGMIDALCAEYSVDFLASYVIGDRETDIVLGKRIGCKTIFVKSGIDQVSRKNKPTYVAKDLLGAVKYILKNS